MNGWIVPALYALVGEQREFIGRLQGHFAPPREDVPAALPARDLRLSEGTACSVHIITPEHAPKGAYLYMHAGGFTQGTAAMADNANSSLVRNTGLACVSVDYRLAPEHPHPAALDDCETAALWLVDSARREFGTEVLFIGGDSVGATLAALTLLRLRDRHRQQHSFRGANLVVGSYDFSMTPSQRASTESFFLSPQRIAETRAAAFPGLAPEDLRDPSISPLYADLQDLPPAIFTVGTEDAVLDDSLFMAARWQAAGNEARLAVYPEAPHLFMTYPTRMAEAAHGTIADFIRKRLADRA